MEQSLILKVSCNYPELLKAIQKNNTYLNKLYQNHKIPFYLESVERGFLFIVENLDAFKKVRDKAELASKLVEIERNRIQFGLEFRSILHKLTAKEVAIVFNVECKSSDSDVIFDILKDNFDQISKEIKVIPVNFNEIQIEFKNVEIFRLYSMVCVSFTQDLKNEFELSA